MNICSIVESIAICEKWNVPTSMKKKSTTWLVQNRSNNAMNHTHTPTSTVADRRKRRRLLSEILLYALCIMFAFGAHIHIHVIIVIHSYTNQLLVQHTGSSDTAEILTVLQVVQFITIIRNNNN